MTPAPAPAPAPRSPRPASPSTGQPNNTPQPRRNGNGPGPRPGPGSRDRRGRGGSSSRGGMRDRRRPPMRGGAPSPKRDADYHPDPVAPNVVRIIPLGGVEEVGRNMIAFE